VGHVGETVLPADLGGPALDLWSLDLESGAAVAAHEVMVVVVAPASAVAGLAFVAP
jgi:hypothetical protein